MYHSPTHSPIGTERCLLTARYADHTSQPVVLLPLTTQCLTSHLVGTCVLARLLGVIKKGFSPYSVVEGYAGLPPQLRQQTLRSHVAEMAAQGNDDITVSKIAGTLHHTSVHSVLWH